MNSMKVYISCPMTVPQETLNMFVKLIRAWGADVAYWSRGDIYSDRALREADAVVVILPNCLWKMDFGDIPSGTRNEILLSKALKKPIYLGYITKSGILGVYDSLVDLTNETISGIAGASFNFRSLISDKNDKEKREILDDVKPPAKKKPEPVDDDEEDGWACIPSSKYTPMIVDSVVGPDGRLLLLLR